MRNSGDREEMKRLRRQSHMPQGSILFEKLIPILLAIMAIIMVLLILFAAGVLAGIVRF
ncbi:MAG TPA: hypothetical protein VIU39_14260 [Anaerolineales bacterium]